MHDMKKLRNPLLLLYVCFGLPAWLGGQPVVQEYRIQNLLSEVVIEQLKNINSEVNIYDHQEGNRLILTGDSLVVQTALQQLALLDVPQMMVTIEFMLVEYFHENDFEWGIDISNGASGNFNDTKFTPGSSTGELSFGFNAVTKLTPRFHFNLRALINEDRAKILTNPHLVVQSGTQAQLNINDRRKIILETATINGVTTTLQDITAGIQLSVLPVPTHDSLIHLDIQGVISEFLPFSSSGEFLIEENSIQTKVDVRDGETLIIGGLILEETNTLNAGVPVLKDIPLIGLLFKRKREVTNYVERVMYITPYLHPVETLGQYQQLRKMTPFEQQVEQVIETDPGFLQYDTTKKTMRRNRRAARRNNQNR